MIDKKTMDKSNILLLQADNRKDGLTIFGKNGEMIFLNKENMLFIKDEIYHIENKGPNEDNNLALSAIELEERRKFEEILRKEKRIKKKQKKG